MPVNVWEKAIMPSGQFGNLARRSWGTKLLGAQLGHSWGTIEAIPVGAQN